LLTWFQAAGDARAHEPVFRNDRGMEFVLIPAGRFVMGSPASEPRRNLDEVQHQVTFTKPFYMQNTEVTVAQWQAVMGGKLFGRSRGSDSPVVRVSWFDTQQFIAKLNALGEGTYRLPTEAEWEYACRAGATAAFAWGDQITCAQAMFCNNSEKSGECISFVKQKGLPMDGPAPVKSYAPNAWGLYDMHGNVWEWCEDWYGPYPQSAVTNPKGPESGSAKVRRGGSFFREAQFCRSANRNYAHPGSRYQTLGFRVVLEPRS
jgi:formylglycine-generating enzyme required for sulfatase activity